MTAFWRQNAAGLPPALFAAALIAGEILGFLVPAAAGLWPWAALFTAFAFCALWGLQAPGCRYWIAALAGLTLAWRSESGRITLESRSRQIDERGLPPTYELDVESVAQLRRCTKRNKTAVSFLSHLGPVPVKVVALSDGCSRIPALGETWRCSGWLSLKKSAPNRYWRRTLWVMDGSHLKFVSSSKCVVQKFYRRVSDWLADRAEVGLGWCPDLSAIGKAMLLGRRADIPKTRRDAFVAAGTMHVFAISGMHVMLVAGVINMLLRLAGFSFAARPALAIPALAAFVMMAGCRPSAVRAAIMASLWLAAGIFGRKPDSLTAWGHAATLVYGLSPAMLFDAGCALSFVVMLGIVLWLRWVRDVASPADALLRAAEREQALGDTMRVRRLLRWHGCCKWLLGTLGVSCAAWIAGTPISALAFGRLTFGSVLANVLVVPLAGISIVLGMAGVAMSAIARPIGALFNNLSALCIWMMSELSEIVARCPGVSWELHGWDLSCCGIWYVCWIALFVLLKRFLPKRERFEVKKW